MTELSIKDQIKKLVDLQKIDAEIFEFKKELKEKPEVVEGFKNEFEQSKSKFKELEEKLKSIQLERRDKELDLKTKEEEMAKSNIQLSQIKTNKEYSAKLSEIEHIKADKSICEEKILFLFEDLDSVSADLEKEKKQVAEQEKIFLAKKKELEDDVKEIEDRIKVLESQRVRIVPEVDKNLIERYEKILNHKQGLAIVPVQGNSCGGCFMNVTHQMINEIKMHANLVECEMCTRLLYLEDDL